MPASSDNKIGWRFPCQSVVAMTELLERAIAKLKTLPASEQDAIAFLLFTDCLF